MKMRKMSQDEINVTLFDEVKYLQRANRILSMAAREIKAINENKELSEEELRKGISDVLYATRDKMENMDEVEKSGQEHPE